MRTRKPKVEPCPFLKNTILSDAFEAARKGITIQDLNAVVTRRGGDPRRMLRVLRRGERKGVRWSVDESAGYLKIHYPAR